MIRKYPSLLLLLFIVSGIVISDQTHWPGWLFLFAAVIFCLGGFMGLRRYSSVASTIVFGFSLLFFSAFHFSLRFYDFGPNHIASVVEEGEVYHIFGRVSDWPDLKTNRTEVRVSLDSIATDVTRKVHGAVLLKISDITTTLQRGDRIEFYGRMYPVKGNNIPGKFDYRRYLCLKGIYGLVYLPTLLDVRIDKGNRFGLFNYIDKLRSSIRESFYRNLSPAAAALAAGFLIGETRDIPAPIYSRFRDTGTLHLLAVSGSNVALVIFFFILILRPFSISRQRRSLILLTVIFVFAMLSYGEPSVMRASIMAVLVVSAGLFQRRYDLNNVIAATAVIILLYDPTQLFDVSFQLSFVTAWGLIFITPRISGLFREYHSRRWYRWLVFPLIISVVAQVCSMPLIALYFHRIPAISVIANLIIVPLVSIAVVGIMLLLLADLIWPLLGMFVGSLLNLLLSFIITLLGFLGGDSAPLIKVSSLPICLVLLFYAFLILTVWSLRSKPIRWVAIISLMAVVNFSLLAGVVNSMERSDRRSIYLFTVPGGIAAIVKQAGAEAGDVIFTGLAGKDYTIEDRIIMPILDGLKIKRIHSLFVISADYDAIDDLVRLAEACRAEAIYVSRKLQKSFTDVLHSSSSGGLTAPIVPYLKTMSSPKEPGYYPSPQGVLADFGATTVVFTDRFRPDHLTFVSPQGCRVLVVGGRLSTNSADWNSLRSDGYPLIVCSKFRQPKSLLQDQPGSRLSVTVPDNVYDLSTLGAVRMEVYENGQKPIDIRPLR